MQESYKAELERLQRQLARLQRLFPLMVNNSKEADDILEVSKLITK